MSKKYLCWGKVLLGVMLVMAIVIVCTQQLRNESPIEKEIQTYQAFISGGQNVIDIDMDYCEKTEEDYVNTQIIGSELEDNIPWESILYQKYERELNENDEYRNECALLGENGWEYAQGCYREIINESLFGGIYNSYPRPEDMSNNSMLGILAAEDWEIADAVPGFGMRIAVSEGVKTREYLYYDSGDMIYIACLENGTGEGDMPEYQMCREVLDYRLLSEFGLDAETIWQKKVNEYEQRIGREITEYCIIDNKMFKIDREAELFFDVTGQLDVYLAKWLEYEAERVFYGIKVTPEAAREVEELLPDGYSLGNRFKDDQYLAVCDLNHDGMEDYVAIIEHEDKTYESEGYTIVGGDMWMFLSDGMGGYERKILVKGLHSCSLRFVADGVLMCDNWCEGIPSAIGYFTYDRGDENFYINQAWQCEISSALMKESIVLMEEQETIGKIIIGDYYRYGENYHGLSNGWDTELYSISLEGGGYIFFEDHACYKNVDGEMEQLVNDEMFRIEQIFAESLRIYYDEIYLIWIDTYVKYLNPRIICGCISGSVRTDSTSDGRQANSYMPFLMDVESGEILDITEMISKEDMLRICRHGMKDKWRNALPEEDEERVLRLIEEEYENACRVTSAGEVLLSMKERRIYFSVTAWGVQMWGNDEEGVISVMLDKEYFLNTPLWYYISIY